MPEGIIRDEVENEKHMRGVRLAKVLCRKVQEEKVKWLP